MRSYYRTFLILIIINCGGCKDNKIDSFQPIMDIYPNSQECKLYLILPPSTCYNCQSEFWITSKLALVNYKDIKCIFCTDNFGFEELKEKCYQSGLVGTNYKIDTVLFDQMNFPNDYLGYPILLELRGNLVTNAIICTDSQMLNQRLIELKRDKLI